MIADPLTWLYSLAVRARNARYDSGKARAERLRLPVISIGNLSVGGSGKTPLVQTLGRWLLAHGIGYDILSRGYRRQSTGVLRVNESGPASMYGDEPLLLARSLHAPVFVGEDRYYAGLVAEAAVNPESQDRVSHTRLHILDDGFQHRRLYRDFDIVLLAPGDLRGSLLPFGRLREPISSLARAHVVAAPADLAPLLSEPNVWHIRRRVVLEQTPPSRPLAFCGLAEPKQFWASLAEIGIQPAATYAFGDHHRYTAKDIALLKQLAAQHKTNGFVTTEKDLVKLDAAELGSVCAPKLVIELDDADAKFTAMLEKIGITS
jgi:tetraacyldisaccharide 4'-kinase